MAEKIAKSLVKEFIKFLLMIFFILMSSVVVALLYDLS